MAPTAQSGRRGTLRLEEFRRLRHGAVIHAWPCVQVLVQGLANSRTFQRFAVRSSKMVEELQAKGTGCHCSPRWVALALQNASSAFQPSTEETVAVRSRGTVPNYRPSLHSRCTGPCRCLQSRTHKIPVRLELSSVFVSTSCARPIMHASVMPVLLPFAQLRHRSSPGSTCGLMRVTCASCRLGS